MSVENIKRHYHSFMEPPQDSYQIRKLVNQVHTFSTDPQSTHRYEITKYSIIIWGISFFETLKFSGKCLQTCLIEIWLLDSPEVKSVLHANSSNAMHSLKYFIVMPLIIFAEQFSKTHTLAPLDYPCAQAANQGTQTTQSSLVDDLQKQIEELTDKNKAIEMKAQQKIDANGKEWDEITQELIGTHAMKYDLLDRINNRLTAELETLRNQHTSNENIDHLLDQTNTQLDSENGILKDSIESLKTQLASSENEIANLRDENTMYETLFPQLTGQLEKYKELIVKLESDIDSLKQKNTTLQLKSSQKVFTQINSTFKEIRKLDKVVSSTLTIRKKKRKTPPNRPSFTNLFTWKS